MIRNLAKCLCLAMTALAASWAYADAVSTARLGSLHPKNGVVVTNVDFTASNTQLVETIEATAPTPDLSPYLRKGEAIPTTGGVYTAMVNLHFNRLSVGVWPSGYRPIDVSGGSGAAFTFGDGVQARRSNTMALGTAALNTNEWSFIWNGDANRYYIPSYPSMSNPYSTRYNGGFHVNPSVREGMTNPLQNFWIGDTNLNDWISDIAPSTAADVGAYPASDGNSLANIVNAWEGYWGGTNVIFEVTNYYGNTSGEFPRLRIKELREGAWQTVWDEETKFGQSESNILVQVAASNRVCRETCAADLAAGLADRAPRAWGTMTDKGSTNVVGNSVWMTAPETYFAGGTEYQRVAVGSGAICVLTDNGAGAFTAGEAGTFRFQDEGGTNFFGFAKSDSYTIGCKTDGITVDGTLVTLRYDVIMGGTDVPIVYWRLALNSGEWVQLNNADGTATAGAPYTVTWYTSGGSYYAAINCGSNASGFFKAETSVAGDVVFETNMKVRLGGGIECENTATGVMGVIRPTYNGSAVSWTWSAR